jgi:hypothetical protein
MSLTSRIRTVQERWPGTIMRARWNWKHNIKPGISTALRVTVDRSWLFGLLSIATVGVYCSGSQMSNPGGVVDAPNSLITLLGAAAAVLASIIAIAVAVALVALEILRGTYAGGALREVFRDATLRHLITLYFFTIVLALGLAGSVGSVITPRQIALSYWVGVLLVICLVVLYPSVKRILSSTRVSGRRVTQLLASISLEAAIEISHPSGRRPSEVLRGLEEHPLFVLSEVALRSISAGDRITPRLIIFETGSRLVALMQEVHQRGDYEMRELINGFVGLFRTVVRVALKHRDEIALGSVIATIATIHEAAATLKLPYHHLIEMDEFLRDLSVACAEEGLEQSSRSTFWSVREILLAHLTHNVPPEPEIWTLHLNDRNAVEGDKDHSKSLQWDNVKRTYIDIAVRATAAASRGGRTALTSTGLITLGHIMEDVAKLATLGPKQKTRIISECLYHAEELICKSPLKDEQFLLLYPFEMISLSGWLEEDQPWSRVALIRLCSTLVRLAESKRLGRYPVNELAAMARGYIRQAAQEPRFAEAVVLICDTFERIATAYSTASSRDDLRILRLVQQELETLPKWYVENEVREPVSEARLQAAIRRVKEINVPADLDDIERLDWPSIQQGDKG